MLYRKKPTTVDAAIAPLLQAIMDLAGVAETRTEAMERDNEEIKRLETRVQVDRAERGRAEAVARMIRAITSPGGNAPQGD